ncbi:MAG TPA: methyltransferase domain-containing protein [Pyrinomonadaceae bacterium]|nr:methyltransferase domain-containing protein [Pyrinomonadaceae bacterium]
MKAALLNYLACPECAGDLSLNAGEAEGIEIMSGELNCSQCQRLFKIVRGIPRFADLDKVDADKQATADKFGWSWQEFTQEDEKYDEQFLGWIAPVRPEFFKDEVVLEGGCGKGRHTRRVAGWGARDIVAVDLSAAVEVAFESTRGIENAHIVQADIYHLPLRQVFDYAFSVGVLHHLPDPQAGFRSLVSKVKPGGHMSAWVYGAENNQWIVRFVNPVREYVTSRMPSRLLFHLAKAPTALMYAASKLLYGPLNRTESGRAFARHLFYNDYMDFVSGFNWREQYNIVFDHLVAPTAFYISGQEFEGWWRDIQATDVVIGWRNKNSWRGFGRINNLPAKG